MPKTITQIIFQKRNKNRCSIYLDEEFGFGLHLDVALKFGLKKGDILTDEQIEEILFAEDRKKAFERALRILSYRDRSEKEMRTKLSKAGYDEKIINLVVKELKRLQLMDEEKFARNYAKTKMVTRPAGEFLLKRELKQKGISDEIIEETLKEIYQEKDQSQVAVELAKKKKLQLKNVDVKKAKKRMSDFLMRRGFNWEIVSEIIEQWDNLDD